MKKYCNITYGNVHYTGQNLSVLLVFASKLYVVQISGFWVLNTVKHNTNLAATLSLTALVTRLRWTAKHRRCCSDCTHTATVIPKHIVHAITLRAKQMREKEREANTSSAQSVHMTNESLNNDVGNVSDYEAGDLDNSRVVLVIMLSAII